MPQSSESHVQEDAMRNQKLQAVDRNVHSHPQCKAMVKGARSMWWFWEADRVGWSQKPIAELMCIWFWMLSRGNIMCVMSSCPLTGSVYGNLFLCVALCIAGDKPFKAHSPQSLILIEIQLFLDHNVSDRLTVWTLTHDKMFEARTKLYYHHLIITCCDCNIQSCGTHTSSPLVFTAAHMEVSLC